jgi:uncharacterized membrane protein YoaK (UPF0700 family)
MKDLQRREFIIVTIGAILLAFNAGIVNSVFVARVMGVSHVTGNVSRFAMDLGIYGHEFHFDEVHGKFGSAVFCYILGSIICGMIIQPGNVFQLGNRYGIAMFIEMILLVISYVVLDSGNVFRAGLVAAIACGLQNAMGTMCSGAILRTTHMTGICTDIGTIIAHRIRFGPNAKDTWKLLVFLPILIGFACGALAGLEMSQKIGAHTLLVPVFLTGTMSVVYIGARLCGIFEKYAKSDHKKVLDYTAADTSKSAQGENAATSDGFEIESKIPLNKM